MTPLNVTNPGILLAMMHGWVYDPEDNLPPWCFKGGTIVIKDYLATDKEMKAKVQFLCGMFYKTPGCSASPASLKRYPYYLEARIDINFIGFRLNQP